MKLPMGARLTTMRLVGRSAINVTVPAPPVLVRLQPNAFRVQLVISR